MTKRLTMRLLLLLAPAGFLASACMTSKPKAPPTELKGYGAIPPTVLKETDMRAPTPGRYLGAVRVGDGRAKLPTYLDLLMTRAKAGEVHYRAILVTSLGSSTGHEYTSAYFPDVVYKPKARMLHFGQAGVLTLKPKAFTSKMIAGELLVEGRKSSAIPGNDPVKGTLALHLQARPTVAYGKNETATPEAFPGVPWIPALTGVYGGRCDSRNVHLQIEASKWAGPKPKDRGPFDGYRILGRLGHADPVLCGEGKTCTRESYVGGLIDPFRGTLILDQARKKRRCRLETSGIICQDCRFSRTADAPTALPHDRRPYAWYPRQHRLSDIDEKGNRDIKGRGIPGQLRGQFYGFLHHEGTDKYQLFALHVKAGRKEEGKPANIRAVATLYFGEGDSSEFAAHKFNEREFGKDGSGFVLEGPGEGFLYVTRWRLKTIEGVWYSKVRGRIGTVELVRDLVPIIGDEYLKMRALTGRYEGDGWTYEIAAAANISEKPWDFYPLRIYGSARKSERGARRRMIEEGIYDFYMDTLAFRLDDGRTVVGRVTPGGMDLFWPPRPLFGHQMGEQTSQAFKKVGEEVENHAKYIDIEKILDVTPFPDELP